MMLNGIDLDGLCEDMQDVKFPEPVQGRVAHIDADFLAYQVSYEKPDDPKSLDDMQHNAETSVHFLRQLAGATQVHLHLTPSTSNKGGRYEHAIIKEYQRNRSDKPKPRYLHIIRDWMGRHFPATLHQECEADDGMSSAQYAAIAAGKRDYSIIVSKDKDLWMVPGLHMDWDTGQIDDSQTDFGRIWTKRRNDGTVKIMGLGQKFFWCQLLMGDPADNISGLPKVPAYILNEIKPTKETTLARTIIMSPNANAAQKAKAAKTLAERKPAACGPVLAYSCISQLEDNRQAYEFVRDAYKTLSEGPYTFMHWKTGEQVTWQQAFVSEMQLLWMRRQKHDPMDVIRWLQEVTK